MRVPDELAECQDVNVGCTNLVSEVLDQAAHCCGLQQDGMDVDALAEESDVVGVPSFIQQVDDRYLPDGYISNAMAHGPGLSLDKLPEWMLLLPGFRCTNGSVQMEVV